MSKKKERSLYKKMRRKRANEKKKSHSRQDIFKNDSLYKNFNLCCYLALIKNWIICLYYEMDRKRKEYRLEEVILHLSKSSKGRQFVFFFIFYRRYFKCAFFSLRQARFGIYITH